jgi:hypothetical protein
MLYRWYATSARRIIRYLVTAGKHVNNTRVITRQPLITKIEEPLESVFSIRSVPRLYNKDPRHPVLSSGRALHKNRTVIVKD